MPVVKNIKQRTTNNSFNTYPIGMNAEFITIPAGTANLYENNVNADEGMNILKNYIDEQLSNARVSFFVDYTDINNQVYNLRVYNDNSTNGFGLRNVINNLPENISNLSVKQLYAPNFINGHGLFLNKENIYNINNIEFMNLINSKYMFQDCHNLTYINNLKIGSNIINAYSMFKNCYNLNIIPNFNTSNVIDMAYMFYGCYNLTNVSNLNTINVTNMYYTFFSCNSLITMPNFNTSNVTNMYGMFRGCNNLINVPNFNTINVTNMYDMFDGCYNLINIPNFNTSNVTNMSFMFSQCQNLINVPNFNTVNVTDMSLMFQLCRNLKSTINFNTSNITDIRGAFTFCNNLTNINRLNLNKVTEIYHMIERCDNLSNSSILNIANSLPYYDNIINANKYNTLDYIGFSNEQINVIINSPYASNYVENHGWALPKVNYELAYTNTSNPDTWINYSLLNQPITSNAKTLRDAFRNKDIDTANIIKLNIISLPGVTNGENLFGNNGSNYNFNKMTTIEHLNMQDLRNAHTLFYNDRNLININNIKCNNIINCWYMFSGCNNLINISNFDTSNVTYMGQMFYSCYNLTNIPNFNTINVVNMYNMFYHCNDLTNIPNFNTSNVINMSSMFNHCDSLITIPNFNTSNVEYMNSMFSYCYNLTTVPNFDTSNVINIGSIFYACYNLINIPNFDTSNVTKMSQMFQQCYNLTTIPNFDTSKVTNMWYTFVSCRNLINVPNFNTSNVTDMYRIFQTCNNLSNQSLDNIAYSLPLYKNIINGNPSVNQYIGLSNEQINNMSANAKQAAENKGWMVLPQIRIDYTYTNGVNGVSKIYNVDTMNGQQIRTELRNVFSNNLYGEVIPATNWFITNITMTSSNCNITDLNSLFFDGSKIKNISLDELDTTHLINLYSTFYMCGINKIPNVNTSNVTNMRRCFSFCDEIINISNLDTSNVIDMSQTFRGCSNLVNISILDIPKVTNIAGIFEYCYNLSLNSLQNIIISIPDRDQIIGTTNTTNLRYLGLTANQINNLPTYYKQMAADKGWYVEGYEPKYTEMLVGTANALGDITFEDTETYPMTLTYDDMFGDYCLENTNQGKANTTSSATLTVSEDLLNVFDPMFRFLVYYSSETDFDSTKIYKNNKLIYEYDGYNGTTSYLDTTFWLEVQAGDVLKFEYEKDSSGDRGLDGCKIYISGWKNHKSYEVRYSTVDAPTTYITKFIPKEDN